MKILTLIILIFAAVSIFWFVKINNKDIKARKEAVPIEAIIEKLRCKQRLKGDKSLIVLSYQKKSYSLFLPEKDCSNYKLGKTINVYYSMTYDKLFLNK